ncbi:MAG: hypothetical protein ACE5EA_06700 [Nitrospirota bacterium]
MMKKYSIVISISLCITAILLFSCASNRVNLVKNNRVFLERLPSKDIYVSRAYVYQEGNDIVISGKVRTHRVSRILSKGHVDIGIFDPDEIVLAKVSVSYPSRVISRRRGYPESSFSVLIPVIPPQGATVRVGYHGSSYSDEKIFDCGRNVAVNRIERGR